MASIVIPPSEVRRWRRVEYEHPSRAALIVEVSETSYQTVEVHRQPEASPTAAYGWRHRSVETLRPPATVAPLVAPDSSIPVADLLP